MFHQAPVLTTPLITNKDIARARERFKSVISHEKHAILRKSSTDHFDYDSNDSDFEGVLREAPKRQKLNFETSATCKKTGFFNLKLFDRYIDVTPFKEDSSLYPICREWIKNHPELKKSSGSIENGFGQKDSVRDKDTENMEENAIDELPAPKALPYDMLGNPISIRIPGVLTDLKTLDAQIGSIWDFFDGKVPLDEEDLPSPAILFQAHLDRWNTVRKRWRLAAQADNRRYRKSFEVINGAYRVTPLSD